MRGGVHQTSLRAARYAARRFPRTNLAARAPGASPWVSRVATRGRTPRPPSEANHAVTVVGSLTAARRPHSVAGRTASSPPARRSPSGPDLHRPAERTKHVDPPARL